MPARDSIHDAVGNALIKDGWTITDDPLRLAVANSQLLVDLGAEQFVSAPRGRGDSYMDTRNRYIALIKEIFLENAAIPVSHGCYRVQPVFDDEHSQYLIMVFGTDQKRWQHHCIAHLEVRAGKIYFYCDGLEYSVAQELFDRGVPDEDMVLAYQMSGFDPQFETEGYKHKRELVEVA